MFLYFNMRRFKCLNKWNSIFLIQVVAGSPDEFVNRT